MSGVGRTCAPSHRAGTGCAGTPGRRDADGRPAAEPDGVECCRVERVGSERGGAGRSGVERDVLRPSGVERSVVERDGNVPDRIRPDPEGGQVSLLILGLFVLVGLLVLGGVVVTQVQLTRVALLDAADAAALQSAQSLDAKAAYGGGLHGTVVLSSATVQQAAAASLAQQSVPNGVRSWALMPGTGSPDGRTAVVRLSADDAVPVVGSLLKAFGGHVEISVVSRARANLDR